MSAPLAADPSTQPTPEPLIKAETVRTLVLALVALSGTGVAIPDPVLQIVVPIVGTVAAAAISWGLTLVSRGKVWALRQGYDVDQVVDEVQKRTSPPAGLR